MLRTGRRPPWLYGVLAAVVALIAIVALAINVDRELKHLDTARSDNVQWTLSQTEVEFLEYTLAMDDVLAGVSDDLRAVRRRFDVFYSRINTLRNGAIYEDLRGEPDFGANMLAMRDYLDSSVAAIDADDATLRDALPLIEARADALRPAVRALSNSGLNYFAREADARRNAVASTLTWLGVVVVALVLALAGTVVTLNRINAQTARSRHELAQSAERMNTIIDTSLDGVIVSDSDGRIVEFSSAAEAMFDRVAAEVIGKDLGSVIVPDHHREAHDAGMVRMRAGGEKRVVGHGRVRLEAKRANGEIFPVELAIQSANTDKGEIFVAFLRDISARVRAEQELVAARDRALAGEKVKTDFLATMSHEIRTPLNGLLGNLSLLQDTDLSGQQNRYIRNMVTSGRLLRSQISDVLDITRYDAGKLQIKSVPMHVGELVQDIIDTQSGTAAANDTTLQWGWIGPPMQWVASDPDRVQHILMNLIGNAVKFTRQGRIGVSAEVLPATDGRPEIMFRIEDTGAGIAADLQARVFDDFVTGNTAYDRDVGGTGLGLSIARRFAHALGGDIGVESTLGVGSTFWVRLPVTPTQAPAAASDAVPAGPMAVALHVLIVEDNAINRTVVREMLQAAGHTTTEASDGREGVHLASQKRFDLILMDISMPVMDGRSATRAIRSGGGASSGTPIVALTANAMAEEQEAFLADGMNGVLIKPLSRPALIRVTADIAQEIVLAGRKAANPVARQAEDSAEAPVPPPADVVDAAHIAETREMLGVDGFATLRQRFVAEGDALADWLAAPSRPEPEVVRARVHKVAGSAAVFGATGYRRALLAAEDAIKADDSDALATALADLPGIWHASKAALGD